MISISIKTRVHFISSMNQVLSCIVIASLFHSIVSFILSFFYNYATLSVQLP